MRPIKRIPFVEEGLPLVGPPLTDPNDHPFASAPPTAAAAVPSFTPSFVTAAAALVSSPSAAGALGVVAPALGGAAPDIAQYANLLLQTVASHDTNAPFGAMADGVAGIGQSHPAEDAPVSGMLQNLAINAATKRAIEAGINKATIGTFLGGGRTGSAGRRRRGQRLEEQPGVLVVPWHWKHSGSASAGFLLAGIPTSPAPPPAAGLAPGSRPQSQVRRAGAGVV